MFPGAFFVTRCTVFIVAIATLMLPQARAELLWKQQAAELYADAKSTVLEARFPFTNTGNAAVDITSVESSCGCTTVNLEKRHYEPRESGEIVARYTIGTQTGAQKKTVQVETNDGKGPTVLTLNIQIPEILRIQPSFVQWNHGEATTPKIITLEMLQDTPAKDLAVQSTAANFTADLKTLVPGRKYELTVRPKSTDQHQFSTLNIRCRFGEDEKVFRAFAAVRPQEPKD